MPAGDAFTAGQRREIDHAIATAYELCGYVFSVYVGAADLSGPRRYAERLHASLDDPDHSVLVLVDPGARQLEIVTGAVAKQNLPDPDVALVALSMQTSFAAGDLVGGITSGIQQLAEHARRPRTLHLDQPGS